MESTGNTTVMTIFRKSQPVSSDIKKVLDNDTTTTPEDFTEMSDLINKTTESPLELLKIIATKSIGNTTSKSCTTTTTEKPFDEFGPPEGVEYIFVPLGVMIFVVILSAVVLIISRRRNLERLRHRLMPLYNFDPGEEGEDDWETELLDEGLGNRQRRQGYQSMDNEENAEFFDH